MLRALAIVLVVNCHIASSYTDRHDTEPGLAFFGIGGHGVDLFFVLSGWLLGHVLLKELAESRSIDLLNFFRRRWLRTLPAYYAVLCLTYLQAAFQGRIQFSQLSYLLFLQGYTLESPPFFGISWSLCVEEHFYLLIAPLILWIGPSNHRGRLVFGFLLLAPPVLRACGFYEHLQQTHVRLDQCAAGVAMAFVHTRAPNCWQAISRHRAGVIALLASLCAWAFAARARLLPEPPLVTYTIISCALVSFAGCGSWLAQKISIPGAYYVATRSYSMYLIHVEAIAVVKRLQCDNFLTEAIAVWAFTVVLAEALYQCIELPFMKMR